MFNLPQVGAQAVLAGVQEFNAASRQVIGQLGAINRATGDLGDVSVASWTRASSATGIATGAIIRSTGLITAALAGVAVAFKELKDAGSVETTFKTIQALSNSTETQIQSLGDTVTQQAQKWGESMGRIAQTSNVLSRAGLSLDDIRNGALEATDAFLKASKGELSVEEAAIAVAQGLTTFHLAASEATRVTDALVNAANGSTASFGDLATSIKYVGTAATVLGAPIEDVAASIAVMAQNSIRGSTAGTGLRAMLQALEKPTKDALAEMQKYNISLFDAQGRFVGLRNLIIELNRAFGEEAVALGRVTEMERANALARIFTTRGAQAAIALATSGTEQFDAALQQNTTTAGIANKVMESFENQLSRVGSSLQALATNGLLPLLPALSGVAKDTADLIVIFSNPALERFRTTVASLGQTFQSIGSVIRPVVDSVAALATSLYNFGTSGNTVNSFLNGFSTVLTIAADAASKFFGALSYLVDKAGEVPQVVDAASTALAILGGLFAANLVLSFTGAVLGATAAVASMIGPVLGLATALATLAVSGITVATSALLAFGPEILAIAGLAVVLIGAYDAVGPAFVSISEEVVKAISNMGKEIGSIFTTFLIPMFGVAFETIGNIVGTFASVILPPQIKAANDTIGLLPIAAAIIGNNWTQIWADIANSVIDAVNAIIRAIKQFVSAPGAVVAGVPALAGLALFANGLDVIATRAVPSVISAVKGIPDAITGAFTTASAAVEANIKKAHDSIQGLIQDTQNKLTQTRNDAALLEQRHGEQGPSSAVGRRFPGDVPELGFPPVAGGGGEGKKPSVADLSKEIQKLLADLPGMTTELADFLAGIAKDYPERLVPMVKAIQSTRNEIGKAVIGKRDLLATTIQLQEVDKNIGRIQAQINKVQIEENLATIGYERQLLGLRLQSLQVAQQMWPLQDRLTALSRQMRDLQQENLDIARQQNELAQQMLPLQNAIADLDKQIQDTQRVNYQLERDLVYYSELMLSTRQQIQQIETQIQYISRENYGLQLQALAVQQRMLPLQQELAGIEKQISRVSREDLENARQRLQLDLGIAKQRQALLDIENAISDITDKRLEINSRGDQLRAQNEVAAAEDRLASIQDKIDAASRGRVNVRDFAALESEREKAQAELDAANKKVEAIEREQAARARNNELASIGLQLQREDIQEVIDPLQRRIDALNAINDIERIQADIEKNSLEQYKRLLEDILFPLQTQLDTIKNIQDIEKLNVDIIVAGLNLQKQLLENNLKPLQDMYDALQRQKEIQELLNNAARLGLEAEKQGILDQLKPLQDKYDALDREKKLEELRNKAVLIQLEAERRQIIAQLEPLEDVRRAIERQQAQVELEQAATKLAYEEKLLQFKELLLQEQLRRADLEETKDKQEDVFESLVLAFLEAIRQSGAFSEQEGLEVAKRLKIWDEQVAKIAESTAEMQRLSGAAQQVQKDIDNIPKDVTVTITYRIVTVGSPPAGASGPRGGPAPAAGDPGATNPSNGLPPASGPSGNEPTGGDTSSGDPSSPNFDPGFGDYRITRTIPTNSLSRSAAVVVNNTKNVNYNVAANYKHVESPASIRQDLSALVAMTQ